tara:strand:- start:27316 stop:28428 length:1113 start_codon:yes stop_codon:yes gene_type:complete
MKLIYLTVATIPNKTAHSKYVMKLCEAFANQKIDTTLVSCVKKEDLFTKREVFDEFKVNNNFNLKRIVAPYHFFNRLLPNGVRFRYHSMVGLLFIVYYKFFYKESIFICHSYFSARILELLKVKYILDLHDDFPKAKLNPMFIIVQSNVLYEKIFKKYPNHQILISRNAVSKITDCQVVEKVEKDNKKVLMSYIGRLEPNTGFDQVVQAIESLNGNYILYVAGDHDRYRSYYEELFEKFPNAKRKIVFLGYLNESEINFLSKNTDVFIALYSKKMSIFGTISPMKVFEYLRFNKCIIAPKINDIEEIIEYYECEDRMKWYKIDDIQSLKSSIRSGIEESKKSNYKKIDVDTWDDKAEHILNKIRAINDNK